MGTGETLPDEPGRLTSGFKRKIQFGDGSTSVAALVAAIEKATEREIEIPAYARNRRLLACVSGATAGEVVFALEDLFGWRLVFQAGKKYTLGRLRLAAAQNPLDLDFKLRTALPPAVHLQWRHPEGLDARIARNANLNQLMIREISRQKGVNWKRVSVAELEPETQRLLALLLFDTTVFNDVSSKLGAQVRWCFLTPKEGSFSLKDDGRGGPPLLEFRVTRPDGASDAWGWIPGTSSLER